MPKEFLTFVLVDLYPSICIRDFFFFFFYNNNKSDKRQHITKDQTTSFFLSLSLSLPGIMNMNDEVYIKLLWAFWLPQFFYIFNLPYKYDTKKQNNNSPLSDFLGKPTMGRGGDPTFYRNKQRESKTTMFKRKVIKKKLIKRKGKNKYFCESYGLKLFNQA